MGIMRNRMSNGCSGVPTEDQTREETANPLFQKILWVSHLLAIFYGVDMGI